MKRFKVIGILLIITFCGADWSAPSQREERTNHLTLRFVMGPPAALNLQVGYVHRFNKIPRREEINKEKQ